MASFWSGVVSGITEGIEKNRAQSGEMGKLKYASDREEALAILKAVMEGNLKPAGEGETPAITMPGQRVAPKGIGDTLMQGFGLRKPQYTKGQGYVAQPNMQRQREERIIQNQELTRASQLRKEFIDRPEVKEFVAIRNKANSMDALLKNAIKGEKQSKVALDQGLITLFNKITDPNSVVRESEYSRTPQNLPLANRFSGAIQKLKKGGAGLTDDDRKSLVWGAKVIVNEQGRMFNERVSEYSGIAGSYGIEPSLIISGIQPHKDYEFESNGIVNQKKYIKTGIDQETGKKVGMLPDGTIEEIMQ